VRTWTDRSKSFSVEAQFLALKDGKINLHKTNGVKIAVPVAKMSVEDLEYVERITGVSLDEDKPLSNIKQQQAREKENSNASKQKVGVTIEHQKKPEYDWFQFFLSCDVTVGLCERYAQTFNKDSMDESVLPDVDTTVLRTLGLREGDIIKVMRHLDNKYGRKRNTAHGGLDSGESDGDPSSAGGLFSGPGGALRNNTRKGRPAPAIQTSDVIDPKAFSQPSATPKPTPERAQALESSAPTPVSKDAPGGFDDDAWDVKPTKQQPQSGKASPPKQSTTVQQSQQTLSGSMQDLTLLTQPLEPIKVQPPAPPQQPQAVQQQSQPQPQPQPQPPQPTGATPSFFAGVNQQPSSLQAQATNASFMQNPQFVSPQIGYGQQQPLQQTIARQRPVAPQFTQGPNSLMPPPPPRPLSAPQTTQQNTFGPPPLQPQMTGIPNSAFQSTPLAPPGQSLAEINQMRMQQQYAQQQQQIQQQMAGFGGQPSNMMPQATGIAHFQAAGQQPNGFNQPMQAQPTGFQQAQPFMNGQMVGGPFPGPGVQQFSPVQLQPTGFPGTLNSPQQLSQQYPQPIGINSILPPPLQPQKTAMQPTVINGFSQGFQPPPVPPIPQQQTIAPLLLQKTGPPPPVRFGVHGNTKKLVPQATGRRANLAQASKSTS
jgi:actin cytoskeleton-regulatory complex protein SLA1